MNDLWLLNFNHFFSCLRRVNWYLLRMSNTATVTDTPEQINMYRLLAIRSGLKLELLGIRHSRNMIFKAAKQITGKKTRIACLAMIEEKIKEAQNS